MSEDKKREFSPIHATHPDPEKIQCKTCKFRDKTVMKMPSGKEVAIGRIRSFCDKYQKPPKSNGKPHDIMYNIRRCEYYRMEE